MAKKDRETQKPAQPAPAPVEETAAVVPETDGDTPLEAEDKAAGEAPEASEPEAEPEAADADAPQGCTLTAEEFAELQAHIASLRKEKDEAVALLQRNQADFDNFRRRNQSVRKDSYDEGKRACITELLPVLDNFERALENENCADAAWRDGVKLVNRQLCDILKKLGLAEIDASGKFDPEQHNAVAQEKTEGSETGDITAVFQKGYRVDDRIVRHSMVKVAE